MNRLVFSLFLKKHFAAKSHYADRMEEWRFSISDRSYTVNPTFRISNTTYDTVLSKVSLWVLPFRTGEDAAADIEETGYICKDIWIATLDEPDITTEMLRSWLLKSIVSYEFE